MANKLITDLPEASAFDGNEYLEYSQGGVSVKDQIKTRLATYLNALYKPAFWVNFDGTGSSPITPRRSYNVTSITKNATGDFTITLTNAVASANFAVTGSISANIGTDYGFCNIATQVGTSEAAPTTTTIRIACIGRTTGVYDPKYVSLIGFV